MPEPVLKEIRDAHFVAPTPIQAQCWPILSAGCDLIGIAKSGSGKTLAPQPRRCSVGSNHGKYVEHGWKSMEILAKP